MTDKPTAIPTRCAKGCAIVAVYDVVRKQHTLIVVCPEHPFELPRTVSIVPKRVREYLRCVCGKERRTVRFFLSNKDARSHRRPVLSVDDVAWCEKHAACKPIKPTPQHRVGGRA